MKKSSIVTSLLVLSTATFCFSFIFNNKTPTSTYAASLPKNINLNKVAEVNVRNYYSDLNSLASEERRGTNLLKNLKPVLNNNFQYYSYDQVWRIYEITDRNWSLSPAEETVYGTYDSITNTISDYEYYSTLSEKKNNPYIHLLYVNNNDDKETALRIQDSHSATTSNPNAINREHCWPQSYGFKAPSGASGPAGTDIHHLIAADAGTNTVAHNNYVYGEVENNNTTWAEHIASRPRVAGNKCGDATVTYPEERKGRATCIFEPQDSDKGDIARALFYMCAKYNNYAATEGAISAYEPFLALSDYIYEDGYSISSTDSEPATYGTINALLSWNKLDPPDEYEIHRNDLIFNNYQFNRNPFIDYPSWADLIWGSSTKAADPVNDPVYKFDEDEKTLVKIELTKEPTKKEYKVGEAISLSGSIINATYDNGDVIDVTSDCVTSPTSITSKEDTTITINYTYKGITKSVTYTIKINEATQDDIYMKIIIPVGIAVCVLVIIGVTINTKTKKHKKHSKNNKK